ncbi:TPA: hypothetical protein ACGOX2_000827 [Streptococcus suis]
MNRKPKRVILRVSSLLMLLAALPMLLWCLNLIDNAALDYTYAGAGCFAAGIAYIFSMVTAIAGWPLQGGTTDIAGAGHLAISNCRREFC